MSRINRIRMLPIMAMAIGLIFVNRNHVAFAGDTSANNGYGSIKPPIAGLISMGAGGYNPAYNDNAAFHGIPGNLLNNVIEKRNAFDGVVINIPWKELEPTASGPIDTAAIDNVLNQIRYYNADKRTTVPLRAILRIWAADNAPDWVKTLDGRPVTIAMNGPGGKQQPYTIGHFWSRNYQIAWRKLQRDLARAYDGEPLIAEVSNTSCTSTDDEWPALAWGGDKALNLSSIDNLHAAGFNDNEYKDCLIHAAEDYDGWAKTPVNLIMGGFFVTDNISGYKVPQRDFTFPQELLHRWTDKFRERAVFANHVLNYLPDENAVPVYRFMKESQKPLEFQTRSPNGLDWTGSVMETICLGGHAMELWNSTPVGGYKDIPYNQLMQWSSLLKSPTETEMQNPVINQFCTKLQNQYGF